MAGRGFAPKDPKRTVSGDRSGIESKTIEFVRAEQPPLPDGPDYPEWHPQTRRWWEMWKNSPQAEHFMASDWDFLLDTALMHTSMWDKQQWTLAAELRLRVAKFGQTPEDRARLRMHFADADEKDAKRPVTPASSREKYGTLTSIKKAAGE